MKLHLYAASTEIDLNTKFGSGDTKLKETKTGNITFFLQLWKVKLGNPPRMTQIEFLQAKLKVKVDP